MLSSSRPHPHMGVPDADPGCSPLAQRFVAQSPAMLAVTRAAGVYAKARTPLVIVGATGTGKTTLAELIHAWSGRTGPFSPHTAGEFDRNLEQSQIFGHERGAFTGAVDRHIGVLEEAGDGTLLLDDFHRLRRSTQTLLLRVLDRGVFRRLHASRDLSLRCRVMIGLVESPDRLVERGTMLDELRYRLGYSVIRMPPLAERREDIPLLAERFLARCGDETGVQGPGGLSHGALLLLAAADWPGNVRQLGMVVRDAYLRAAGSDLVGLKHVPDVVHLAMAFKRRGNAVGNANAVRLALEITHGGVEQAARLLRTSRTTVYAYLDARADASGVKLRARP